MAETIQLHFGATNETGDAFRAIDADLRGWQRTSKDALKGVGGAFSQLSSAIGGEFGGAVSKASSLLRGLSQGGLWGAAAAAAGIAVSSMIDLWKKHNEEVEKHKKLMADMKTAYRNYLNELVALKEAQEQQRLDAIVEKAKAAITQLDRLAAAFRGLAAAEEASVGAGGNLKIAQITDRFNEELNEACEQLKPLVQAQQNLAIALSRQETAQEECRLAVEREKSALVDLEAKIGYQQKVIEAETAAGHSVTEAYQKLQELQIQRTAAAQRLQNAETNAETSTIQHKVAVENATAAVAKAEESWNAAIEANEKDIEKTEDLITAKGQLAELLAEQAQVQESLNFSLKQKDIESETAKQDLKSAQDLVNNVEKGVIADNKTHEWLPHDWKRDSNGRLKRGSDIARAARAYERQQAKEDAYRAKEMDKADKTIAALEKKGEKNWTAQDKKAYEDAQNIKKYLNGEDDANSRLEQLAEERKEILKESRDHLKDIKDKIDKLGIK